MPKREYVQLDWAISTAAATAKVASFELGCAEKVGIVLVPSTTAVYTATLDFRAGSVSALTEVLVNSAANTLFITTAARTAYTDALNVVVAPASVTAAMSVIVNVFKYEGE